MSLRACVIVAAALPIAAAAQQVEDFTDVAYNLGQMLAAESYCGMTYNQAAIAAFIDERVDPREMRFLGMLQTMTAGAEMNLRDATASQKTAHCRAAELMAREAGFIPAR